MTETRTPTDARRARLDERAVRIPRSDPTVPRLVWGVGGVVASSFLLPPLVVVAPLWGLVRWWRDRRQTAWRRRQEEDDLPELVELLRLSVDAGLGLQPSIERASLHGTGAPAEALEAALGEVRRGRSLADALGDVPERAGHHTQSVIDVLVATARYGDPLLGPLDLVGRELRADRRRRRHEAAQALPVRMLFPLVCCVLPAFLLLTLVPLLVVSLSRLPL